MGDNINRLINRGALFSSETEDYRFSVESDVDDGVLLRMRISRGNASHVCYVEDKAEAEMVKVLFDNLFDYYEHEITVGIDQVFYRFKVVSGQDACLYNRLGPVDDGQACFDFKITPGFHTPDWAKGVVMYQIYVDRSCNGDKDNDVESYEYVYIGHPVQKIEDWSRNPSATDVGCSYRGDLQGAWDKPDYIKNLGVGAIYLNPIFVSPSNHKYDCQDYEHIDSHFGRIVKGDGSLVGRNAIDNKGAEKYIICSAGWESLEASDAFFAELAQEIHKRGMKIMLDGVFNHCDSLNKWLDVEEVYKNSGGYKPGAHEARDSPYRSLFQFHDERDQVWPCNAIYDSWWDHDTLPKLNHGSSGKLMEYALNVAKKRVSPPYSTNGWRLDAAVDLGHTAEYNHSFWRRFRQAVKEVNPQTLILARHYGDPVSWLEGDQWDSIMSYDAFVEPVTWSLTGMEKYSDSYNGSVWGDGETFFNVMKYRMSRMQTNTVLIAMNQPSNHDYSRFFTRTNQVVGRTGTLGPEKASENVEFPVFREVVVIQMTWPDAFTLYYGDEAGVCGWTDPDSRRTYLQGSEDLELIESHRCMAGVHNRLPVFKKSSVKPLMAKHQQIASGRMYREHQAVTVVSNSPGIQMMEIPAWQSSITDDTVLGRPILTMGSGYNTGIMMYWIKNGLLKANIPSYSATVFISRPEDFYPAVDSRFADGVGGEKQKERSTPDGQCQGYFFLLISPKIFPVYGDLHELR